MQSKIEFTLDNNMEKTRKNTGLLQEENKTLNNIFMNFY